MPAFDGAGCSESTVVKQDHFAKFLHMHMQICKGQIGKVEAHPPYIFFDLHAGPGTTYDQDGSPLIFARKAMEFPFPCLSYHFDKKEQTCRTLSAHFRDLTADSPVMPHEFNVMVGDHNENIDCVLSDFRFCTQRFSGLIYADPNGGVIPVEVINKILSLPCFARLEVLIGVNATAIKRVCKRFADRDKPNLAAQLDRVKKSVIILREPVGRWQFSLVLLTNWAGFPVMERQGFHKINTMVGQEIMRELNLTHKEKGGNPPPPRLPVKPQLGFKF